MTGERLPAGLPEVVLGVDCSTTAAKTVAWDERGNAVASARAEFPLEHPRPGWGEQNAEDWWTATAQTLRAVARSLDPRQLRALCITHQRETFVCLDAEDRQVRPAMLWMDGRAVSQVHEYGTAEVHRITGKPPNVTPGWYKLLWMAEHEPQQLRRTAKVVDVHAYLVHRLTGEWATSWASADPLGLVDMTTFDYHDGLLEQAGLTRSQLPVLVAPGTVLGSIADDVADSLGLPRGLPLVAGVGDGQAAQVGVDALVPGRAYLNLGTGVVSGTYGAQYRCSTDFRVLSAADGQGYTFETFIGGGTQNLQWFVQRFAGVDTRALGLELTPEQVLETAAATLPPGCGGLMALPYWTGALTPYWDHHARGVLLGLTSSHGKSHVYRALLEGIAFEQRLLTDGLEAAGGSIDRLIALGGGSRSRVWCQIIADVLERDVEVVSQSESTCLGAGMMAAVATGWFADLPAAGAAMARTGARFTPDPATVQTYRKLYEVYRQVYPALRGVFPQLVAAGEP